MIPIIILLIIIAVLAVVSYYLLRWLFTEMAKKNIVFTLRTEGEIKAIMRGDKCVRYVMAVENYIIDPVDFDIFKGSIEPVVDLENFRKHLIEFARLKLENKKKNGKNNPYYDSNFKDQKLGVIMTTDADGNKWIDEENTKLKKDFEDNVEEANKYPANWFENAFGVVWVGFPPYRVFTYNFRWIKYAQQKGKNDEASMEVGMHPREEVVDSLYFRYPTYGIVVDDAETGAGSFGKGKGQTKKLERIQLSLEFIIETETTNPQKTLFRTAGLSSAGDWLSAISKETRAAVRKWVGQIDYDTLIKEKEEVEKELNRIREEVNGVKNGNRRKIGGLVTQTSAILDYGQRILKISLVNMDLKDKELQKSINEIFNAEQKLRMADKESKRLVVLAEGQQAEAAAPLKGKAEGLKDIAAITGGKEMYVSEQLGQLRGVYAPGQDKVFLNVATGVTGSNPPTPEKKDDQKKGSV